MGVSKYLPIIAFVKFVVFGLALLAYRFFLQFFTSYPVEEVQKSKRLIFCAEFLFMIIGTWLIARELKEVFLPFYLIYLSILPLFGPFTIFWNFSYPIFCGFAFFTVYFDRDIIKLSIIAAAIAISVASFLIILLNFVRPKHVKNRNTLLISYSALLMIVRK